MDVFEDVATGRIVVFPLKDEKFSMVMMRSGDTWEAARITEEDFFENFVRIEDEKRAETLFEESKLKRGDAALDDIYKMVTAFTRSKRKPGQKWVMTIAENEHFPDEHPYFHGEYDTEEEAIAEAKRIIDEDIVPIVKNHPDISFDELWDQYTSWGADPHIGGANFSSWDYAKKRCKELTSK